MNTALRVTVDSHEEEARSPRLPGLLDAVAVAPAPGRQVATGKAVPIGPSTEVRLDVGRGSYQQAAVIACAHCDAVLVLLEGSLKTVAALGRRRGWQCDRGGWGWTCGECSG